MQTATASAPESLTCFFILRISFIDPNVQETILFMVCALRCSAPGTLEANSIP